MDVWYPSPSLLEHLMNCLEDFGNQDFDKKDIQNSFEFPGSLSEELGLFLFEPLDPRGQNRYTRTIGTILEILTNMNFIELSPRQGYFRLKGLEKERKEISYQIGKYGKMNVDTHGQFKRDNKVIKAY